MSSVNKWANNRNFTDVDLGIWSRSMLGRYWLCISVWKTSEAKDSTLIPSVGFERAWVTTYSDDCSECPVYSI